MSVTNIVLSDSAVRIVSDTVTYSEKEPVEFNQKVAIYPAARLALTVRGRRWLNVGFGLLARRWTGFADAVAVAPDAIAELLRIGAEQGKTIGEGFELTIAGWQDGPRVTRLIYRPDRAEIDRLEFAPGVYLAPSLGKQDIPIGLTEAQLVAIAFAQQKISKAHGLNMCIGGDVMLTTITAEGVETRQIASYPDKEMTARRMPQATRAGSEAAVA